MSMYLIGPDGLNRHEIAVLNLPAGHLARVPQLVAAHAHRDRAFERLADDGIRGGEPRSVDRRWIDLFRFRQPRVLLRVPLLQCLERVVRQLVVPAARNAVDSHHIGIPVEVTGQVCFGEGADAIVSGVARHHTLGASPAGQRRDAEKTDCRSISHHIDMPLLSDKTTLPARQSPLRIARLMTGINRSPTSDVTTRPIADSMISAGNCGTHATSSPPERRRLYGGRGRGQIALGATEARRQRHEAPPDRSWAPCAASRRGAAG